MTTTAGIIKFSSLSGQYAFLSNWYLQDFTIDGKSYYHVEGYMQSVKFKGWHDKAAMHLQYIYAPRACRSAADRYIMDEERKSSWEAEGEIRALKRATTVKFICNMELLKRLVDTGDQRLVCEDSHEKIGNMAFIVGEVLHGVRSICRGILSTHMEDDNYMSKQKAAREALGKGRTNTGSNNHDDSSANASADDESTSDDTPGDEDADQDDTSTTLEETVNAIDAKNDA